MATHLEYVRKADHVEGGVIPLPEGWPAQAHVEPDLQVAKAKLDSGRYRRVDKLGAKPEGEQPTFHPHNEVVVAAPPAAPVAEVPATPAASPAKEG